MINNISFKKLLMTIKKTFKILDWLIEQETSRAEGLVDPKHSWNQGFDCMRDLATSLSDSIQNEVEVLQILRKNYSESSPYSISCILWISNFKMTFYLNLRFENA